MGKRILCEPQNQQNYFAVINFLTRVNQYFSLKIFLFRTVKIRSDQFELGNPKGRGEKIGRAWASRIGDQRNFPYLPLSFSSVVRIFFGFEKRTKKGWETGASTKGKKCF